MRGDVSSNDDQIPTIEIDRTDPADRWLGCAHASEQSAAVSPEHYDLLDKRSGKLVPWAAVELAECLTEAARRKAVDEWPGRCLFQRIRPGFSRRLV